MKYYKNITVGLTVGVQKILAARQGQGETPCIASALGTYKYQTHLKICNKRTNKMQYPLSVL